MGVEDKSQDCFSPPRKGISSKVNMIKQLEFELAYYDVTL